MAGSSAARRRRWIGWAGGALALAVAVVWWAGAASGPRRRADSAPARPALVTVLAGSREDTARGAALDAEGNLYLAGGTASPDFPVTPGAYQTRLDDSDPTANGAGFGPHDVWVAKLSPSGERIWSTLVGGPGYDRAYAVEVDATGVYVGGRAGVGFPTTPGSLQPEFAGDARDPNRGYGPQDGFVLKLSPDGRRLLWSTYFGDPGRGFLRDIAVDAAGEVVVIETSMDAASPHATPGSFGPRKPPGRSALVARLSGDGARVVWGGYLGGSGDDLVNPSVRIDERGRVFVSGETTSPDFPTTPGAFQSALRGPSDMALVGIAADGRSLLFSTYLGGSGEEEAETHSLAIAPGGDPVVAAITHSADFPTTEGAFQSRPAGAADPGDGFVARFAPDGALRHATRIGGRGKDWIEGVGVDGDGRIWVAGGSRSPDAPVTPRAYQSASAGDADQYVAWLSPDLGRLLYASLLGGRGEDAGRSAAVARDGRLLVGGMTVGSTDFPTSDGSRVAPPGGADAYTDRDATAVLWIPVGEP